MVLHECVNVYAYAWCAYFNPQVDDSSLDLSHFPPSTTGVLWENWPLDKVCLARTMSTVYLRIYVYV